MKTSSFISCQRVSHFLFVCRSYREKRYFLLLLFINNFFIPCSKKGLSKKEKILLTTPTPLFWLIYAVYFFFKHIISVLYCFIYIIN
ncbi:hypothetical protein BDF21DRAFT_149406 [Thamnidium elegans]|nr:hypothetical protein BDF21DRAFT_149406 [Thamnidium elegans]